MNGIFVAINACLCHAPGSREPQCLLLTIQWLLRPEFWLTS